jgi:hypothetical protein
MTTTGQDFVVVAGDARTLRFTVEEHEDLDLLEATSLMWSAGGGPSLTADGDAVEALEALVVVVRLLPEHTAGLVRGDYPYQLRVVDTQDRPSTLAEGVMTVRRSLHPPG